MGGCYSVAYGLDSRSPKYQLMDWLTIVNEARHDAVYCSVLMNGTVEKDGEFGVD